MEAAEESTGSRSVCQSFHGIFQDICKNVTTVEAWIEVRRALHVVNSSVMQMAAEADKNKGLEGVSSLPATRNSARKKKRNQSTSRICLKRKTPPLLLHRWLYLARLQHRRNHPGAVEFSTDLAGPGGVVKLLGISRMLPVFL